jgi:hypothetical protein
VNQIAVVIVPKPLMKLHNQTWRYERRRNRKDIVLKSVAGPVLCWNDQNKPGLSLKIDNSGKLSDCILGFSEPTQAESDSL